MNPEDLARAIVAAAAGTFIGWAGSALTLSGRVQAIEATLQRIETRLDATVTQQNQKGATP